MHLGWPRARSGRVAGPGHGCRGIRGRTHRPRAGRRGSLGARAVAAQAGHRAGRPADRVGDGRPAGCGDSSPGAGGRPRSDPYRGLGLPRPGSPGDQPCHQRRGDAPTAGRGRPCRYRAIYLHINIIYAGRRHSRPARRRVHGVESPAGGIALYPDQAAGRADGPRGRHVPVLDDRALPGDGDGPARPEAHLDDDRPDDGAQCRGRAPSRRNPDR